MAQKTVVFLPALGAGHFTPSLEAAKRLLRHLNIPGGTDEFLVTVLLLQARAPDIAAAIEERVAESCVADTGHGVTVLRIPHATAAVGEAECLEDLVSRHFELAAPHVRRAIEGSPVPVAAVVVDFLATAALDVAAQLGVPA